MPTTWIIMNWLSAYLWWYAPPFALVLAFLLLRPIVRGLRVPRRLKREQRLCGNCGHGCPEQIPERCAECGHTYATAGVLTPNLITRTREGLPTMLLSWAVLCVIVSTLTWLITIRIMPDVTPPQQWNSSVALAAEREHLWDEAPSPTDQRYEIIISADAVSFFDPTTGQSSATESAEFTLNIVPEIGPAVLIESALGSDDWTATGLGAPINSTGINPDSLARWYEEAGLDLQDPRVVKEMDLLEGILQEVLDNPHSAIAMNGVWNKVNGLGWPAQSIIFEQPEDPVLDVSFPWEQGGSSSWGTSGREMELVLREDAATQTPAGQFPVFSESPVKVWADLKIQGSELNYQSNHIQKKDTFTFSMTDRTGWPVVISVNFKTQAWTLNSDPDLGERTGSEVTAPHHGTSVWRLAWIELGRDPDDEDGRLALDALHAMLLATIENPQAAINPNHKATAAQMQSMSEEQDTTPGGFTHSNSGGGMSRPMYGTATPPGYTSLEEKAAYVVSGSFAVIWILGAAFMIRRRRSLIRVSAATIPASA